MPMDFDKLSPFWQAIIAGMSALGIFVSGTIGLASRKKAQRQSDQDVAESLSREDRDRIDREQRSKQYELERKLELMEFRADFEVAMKMTRDQIMQSIEGRHSEVISEIKKISAKVQEIEVDVAVLQKPRPSR